MPQSTYEHRHVTAFGVTVRVTETAPFPKSYWDRFDEAWAELLVSLPDDDAPTVSMTPPPSGVADPDVWNPSSTLTLTTARITRAALEVVAGTDFLFHAGAVAQPDGRVLGFVGPSGRGKSTAVMTLARKYGYVTDETLRFDYTGKITPYRKPVSILDRQGEPKYEMTPAELDLLPLPNVPLQLAGIVLLNRLTPSNPEYESFPKDGVEIVPVDLAEAISDLVPQTSSLHRMPRPLRPLLELIASTGGLRSLRYREARNLEFHIEELLNFQAPAVELWDPVFSPVPSAPAPAGPLYERADFHDALGADGSLILLRGEQVIVLAGLGPVVWEAASGASLEQLVSSITAAHGTPPGVDVAAAISEVARDLAASGILQTR